MTYKDQIVIATMYKEELYNWLLALAIILSIVSLVGQYCTYRSCKRIIKEDNDARLVLANTVRELAAEIKTHNGKLRDYGTLSQASTLSKASSSTGW